MSEENGQVITEEKIIEADNQLGAGMWGEKPAAPVAKPADAVVIDTPIDKPEDKILPFDESAYLKQHFGVDNIELAKQQLVDLKLKAETPAEIKFVNEESRKFFELINDPTRKYELAKALSEEYEIEQASKIEISDIRNASDIIKLNYKYKYKDLSKDEINDMFHDSYVKPERPELGDTETEEDSSYKAKIQRWEQQCESVDKRLIRDAKMAKPELSQFKSQIVFPDIPKLEPPNKQPTQEELDTAKKVANDFINDAETSIKSLNEFSLTYKDEAVEIPINYVLTADEKLKVSEQVKAFVGKNYDANAILAPMWLNEDGSINVSRMTSDLAYLNNRDRIAQKFVDDAVGKRMDAYIKQKKSIDLSGAGGQNNNGQPDTAKALEAVEAAIWEGKK